MSIKAKQKKQTTKQDQPIKINLEFEEVLSDLLKIKPVENSDLKKGEGKKKKSKPKVENSDRS